MAACALYFSHTWRFGPLTSPLRGTSKMAITAKMAARVVGMKSMSAKDAKNAFGLLLDTARAEPVTIEKHGRRVVVVVSVEEYERLTEKRPESLGGAKSVAAEKGKGG